MMIIINFTTETGKLGLGTNDDQLCYSLTVRFSSCLAGHEHGQLCHMMIDVNDVVWFAGKTVWYTWAPSVRAYIHLPLPFTLHTANGCVAISFAIAASDRKKWPRHQNCAVWAQFQRTDCDCHDTCYTCRYRKISSIDCIRSFQHFMKI